MMIHPDDVNEVHHHTEITNRNNGRKPSKKVLKHRRAQKATNYPRLGIQPKREE